MSRRDERRTTVVRVVVQHDAEGVNVDAGAIRLALVDFGRHVGVGSGLCKLACRLVDVLCDAEVAELESAVFRNKDVFGLYVTVNDGVFAAQLKCAANVDAQANNVVAGEGVVRRVLKQRGEQLHADKNVPADAVSVFSDLVIFIAHNGAFALELRHDVKLFGDAVNNTAEVLCNAVGARVLGGDLSKLRLVSGDGDHLERRAVCAA